MKALYNNLLLIYKEFFYYNIYLNKLAEDEYILYGKSTKFTPLIVKLEEVTDFPKVVKEPLREEVIPSFDGLDINGTENKTEQEIPVLEEQPVEQPSTQEVEDNNLSFASLIEDQTNELATPDDENIEVPQEDVEEVETVENDEIEEEETDNKEEVEAIEDVKEAPSEPVDTTPEFDYEAELKAQLADINISDDDIADVVAQTKGTEIIKGVNDNIDDIAQPETEEKPSLNPSDLFKANDDTSVDSDEPEEDSDLTDEDLDMIEALGVDVESDESTQSEPQVNISEQSAIPQEIEEKEEEIEEVEKKTSITDEILQEEAERKAQEEAQKVDPVEEMIEKPEALPEHKEKAKALETKEGHTPIVPVYSAEIPDEDIVESDVVNQGDKVEHSEFGRGIVEKIINYGDRTLCSVNFEQVGRRLLDPKISELKKL